MSTTSHKIAMTQVSPNQALEFIQDVGKLVRLNPLVIGVEKVPEKNVWRVIDRIYLLGFISCLITYEISVVFVEGGCDATVSAPLGVRTLSKWRVTDGEEGGSIVTEEASIEAPYPVLWYIRGTLKQSHEEMLQRMEEELHSDISKA